MEKKSWIKKLPVAALALGIIISAAAFQTHPSQTKSSSTDTLPERPKKIKDIDEALEELEKSKDEVDRSLKEIDFQKIEKEIREATKAIPIDAAKMQADIQKAIKEIDMVKIQADIQQSLKEIDAAKIEASVDKVLKEVDFEKIKADVEASIAKIDAEKITKELEKVKSIDFEKIENELKKIKPEIDKSIKEAQEGIEKAKIELRAYKGFIDGLERDGLINKKESYTIEYKKGELIINGKKQPSEITKKYEGFLKGRKDFKIQKEDDDFNINDN